MLNLKKLFDFYKLNFVKFYKAAQKVSYEKITK